MIFRNETTISLRTEKEAKTWFKTMLFWSFSIFFYSIVISGRILALIVEIKINKEKFMREVFPMPERQQINKSKKRVDARAKVTGKAKFGADLKFHNMLYGKVVRSNYPHARIKSINTDEAEAHPEVAVVMTAEDIPHNLFGVIIENQQVLAEDRVLYIGDGVAMLAADSREAAREAAELIEVEYEELPGVFGVEEARRPDAPVVMPGEENNQVIHHPLRKGDVEQGMAQADVVLERQYTTQFVEHAYLEPEAVTVIPEERNTLVTVYGSVQNPNATRDALATVLDCDLSNVRIIQDNMGGSFGGKDENISSMACRAALMALQTGRPVQLVNTREESIIESYKRHPYTMKYRIGARENGELVAMEIEAAADSGAYACQTPFVTWRSVVQATGPYEVPHVKTDTYGFYTNSPYTGAMRGYGSPPVIFAQESMMDELARELGISPEEIRRKNMFANNSRTASNQKLDNHEVSLAEVMDKALEAIDYQEKYRRYSQPQPGDIKRGIGFAISYRGVSLGAEAIDAAGAIVSVQKDGSIIVYSGLAENGQGLKTIFSQIAAEELGVSLDRITHMETDTSISPESGSTVASRSTLMGGSAVKNAAENIKTVIKEFVAEEYDYQGEIVYRDDALFTSEGSKLVDFPELAANAFHSGVFLSSYGWYKAPGISWDEETGQGRPYFTYVYGCQAAEVEVDTGTGEVRVLNMAAAHDVGKAINPANVRGQIYGGTVMALGHALMEDLGFSEGYIRHTNFDEYLIPTIKDAPDNVEAIIVENPDPAGPYGAKSIGEPAMELGGAAINNALSQATGRRLRDLPLNLERVLLGRNLSREG